MAYQVTCIGGGRLGVYPMLAMVEHWDGCHVTIVDSDYTLMDTWISGHIPFEEPGLEDLINRYRGHSITFDTDIPAAIQGANTIFLAVELQTNRKSVGSEKDSMDFSKWERMVFLIRDHSQDLKNVIDKSGALFGQENKLVDLLQSRPGAGGVILHHRVYSNPEFFRRGTAIHEVMNPIRVVLGIKSGHQIDEIMDLYQWIDPNLIVILDHHNSAEMCALINSIYISSLSILGNLGASLCQSTGVNINDVSPVVRMDMRLRAIPNPHGLVGGPVLLTNLRYAIYLCKYYALKEQRKVLESLLSLNKSLLHSFQHTIRDKMVTLKNKTIVMLGFGFKPKTCDISESPAIFLSHYLLRQGARVRVLDKYVPAHKILACFSHSVIESEQLSVMYHRHLGLASQQADAVCCVVRSNYFPTRFHEQLQVIAENMRRPAFFFDFSGNQRFRHGDIRLAGLRSYGFGLGVQ